MISKLSVKEFQQRIFRFEKRYVEDWKSWIATSAHNKPSKLAAILRKWQACRQNTMRRVRSDKLHEPPYIEDLIDAAEKPMQALVSFEVNKPDSFSIEIFNHFSELWNIFEGLPYKGKAHNGKAGIAGISKAVLLLSDGRIGPAFDSNVRANLQLNNLVNAKHWYDALREVSKDIQAFETKNDISIINATPQEFQELNIGRIYDMALGPGD